jgi:hypothetical protein
MLCSYNLRHLMVFLRSSKQSSGIVLVHSLRLCTTVISNHALVHQPLSRNAVNIIIRLSLSLSHTHTGVVVYFTDITGDTDIVLGSFDPEHGGHMLLRNAP